ncbi:MAG: N-acetyltransferase [Bacillota bacterium]
MPAGTVSVTEAATGADLRAFVHFPYDLYRADSNWVPPLYRESWAIVKGAGSQLLTSGPHVLFLARRDGAVAGRVAAGIDLKFNELKDRNEGYVTLFEADSANTAGALLDRCCLWLQERGIASVRGPISPTNGDDYRGVLVWGFEHPHTLLCAYNPPEYDGYFAGAGFSKYYDYYSYRFDAAQALPERYRQVSDYAMRRYGFRVDTLDLAQFDRDVADITAVMATATPEDWPDLTPPTLSELRAAGEQLRPLAVPGLVLIARYGAAPIGVGIGMPDYNQCLRRMGGRLFPWGWLKFLFGKRRITAGRFLVLFVVPEWQKRAVTGAIFVRMLAAARRLGYTWGEGSTIGEFNLPMRREAEAAGGMHYKTHRVYRLEL